MEILKTINGKRREEVLELLQADFPKECIERNYGGFAYFSIRSYQERLNEVIGSGNFDYIEDQLSTVTVGGVTAVNIRGTIIVRYDDGSVWVQRTAFGSENVGVRSDDDKNGKAGVPNDLSNSVKAAGSDAFVQCCRKLGIGDRQLREIRNEEKVNKKGKGSSGKSSAGQSYKIKIGGSCSAIGEKGFKLPAFIGEEKVSLKIWVNSEAYKQITSYVDTVPNFASKYSGKCLTIVGKKGAYNGETELEACSLVVA